MKKLLMKTPQCEINFENLCDKEYQKINHLMSLIEKEFSTDMNSHTEIRHEILDISNFIKRLPSMISEVM
jgi:hypothetical protein